MDSNLFRRTLGLFGTGVTVVTTAGPDGVQGMTANAFSSVSLDPPLVLVCVDRKARTHERIREAQAFGISFLRSDQKELSLHFAGKPTDGVGQLEFRWVEGVPVLASSLGWIVCSLWTAYDGGDHTIYVGQAVEMSVGEGEPLVFWNSRYWRLAEVIP